VCGLTGILTTEPLDSDTLRARLGAMIATLRHRGPDAHGVWTDGRVGLAHARLSIIDLSSAGHQPMCDADQRVWLVFNGEIYNFRALRAELEQKGHRFRSRTDSEVIVHGYKQWGDAILARLHGMFALAIWDVSARRLVLARDRLGKKPLFYAETSSGLIFGSEIKALLAWPGVPRAPNLTALHDYLSFQYVPSPQTAFAGVRCLPPAHSLSVEVGADGRLGAPSAHRYWSLPEPRHATTRRSSESLCEELVSRLDESVRLRMIADVPIGAFLSGGVDSAAIVAMMARAGGRIRTFSIAFEQPDYDESAYARLVAARYGTDHHELVATPDAARILPQLVWHYNQPFADPSAVPSFHLAQLTKQHVGVALTGDGGDECFMGYGRYSVMRRLAQIKAAPRWAKRVAAWTVDRLPTPRRYVRRRAGVLEILRDTPTASADCYGALIAYFFDDMKHEGYAAAMRERLDDSSLTRLTPFFEAAPDLASAARRADVHTYLPDDLLVKVDVSTMAHGLEARSPLLDHELMEWAVGLSASTHMARGVTKSLFKRAMRPYLPKAVVSRPKMGFGCPVGEWLRTDLNELACDLLLSPTFAQRELFEPAYVRRLLDRHRTRAEDHGTRLWALLMLELWFRMWIDRDGAAARPSG
jgi:asparagine synthase (glutamine-hydrolysing)